MKAVPKPLEITVEYMSGMGFLGPEVKNPSFLSIDWNRYERFTGPEVFLDDIVVAELGNSIDSSFYEVFPIIDLSLCFVMVV